MASFRTKLAVAAAVVAAAAGVASGQTMKAEIPFAFRANGAVMSPGTYQVTLGTLLNGTPVVYLLSDQGHHSALARTQTSHDPPRAWVVAGKPVLNFECGAKLCSLVGVWGGHDEPAHDFAAPKLGKDEPAHMAVISLQPQKGE